MNEKWYHLTVEQTEARLKTDSNRGLSMKNAAKRIHDEGANTVYKIPHVNTSGLAREVLRDASAYMLIISALLGFVFKQHIASALVILLVLVNWFAVLCAYIKARFIISDASQFTLPLATVIRDSKQYIVNQDRLCRGDVIILNKGDVVPADARLVECRGLVLNEESLTGEKVLKKKNIAPVYGNNLPLEFQHDMVFATTVVVQGRGKAIVCRTAKNNMACVREAVPTIYEHNRLRALSGLKKYGSVWSTAMLIMIFVMTAVEFFAGFNVGGLFTVFSTGLSVAAAGMCEYYIIFAYITMGRGLYGILRRDKNEKTGATIKHSKSIEKLAKVSTIIMPKEGAFTSGTIRMEKLYCDSTLLSCSEKRLERLCYDLITCALDSTSYPQNDYEKAFNRFKGKNVSAQERTILSCAQRLGVFDLGYAGTHILLEHREENGQGTIFKSLMTDGKEKKLTVRGGLEDILPLCSSYRSNERIKSIKNEKQRIKSAANIAAKEGLSVVCIASKVTETERIAETSKDRDLVFEGFLAISEPQLSGADESVRRMQEAGIKILMLSDEASVANRNYAKSIGIIKNEDNIMTAAYFNRISDQSFIANADSYTLFENLDTVQKRRLVALLRQKGECVGYFGNDFEDLATMEEADIGYSSGITLNKGDSVIDLGNERTPVHIQREEDKGKGCEAMKLKCDVIVSPADRKGGGFNAIVSSVLLSKTVLLNLDRMVRFLICAHASRITAVIVSLIIAMAMPAGTAPFFTPVQILLLGLIADLLGIMSIVFCPAQRNNSPLPSLFFEKPLITNLRSLLYGFCWGALSVLLPIISGIFSSGADPVKASSMMFYGLLLAQPVVICEVLCEGSVLKELRYKLSRAFLALICFILIIIILPVISAAVAEAFGVTKLSPIDWSITVLHPLAVFGIFEFTKLVIIKDNSQREETEYETEEDDD